MGTLTFNVANSAVSSLSVEAPISILGKNGSSGSLGVIPLICESISVSGSDLTFTVKGFDKLTDLNFNKHVLSVNDGNLQLSVGSVESEPHAISARPDLSRFYFLGEQTNTIYQAYSSVPGDVSSARVVPTQLSIVEPRGLSVSASGKYLYVSNSSSTIFQFELQSPWDITTANLSRSISVSSVDSAVSGLTFSSDGSKMFLCSTNSNVNYYTLSTPWNLSTASFIARYGNAALGNNQVTSRLTDIKFDTSGRILYLAVAGNNAGNKGIHRFSLTEPYALSTASWHSFGFDPTIVSLNNKPGIFFKDDGKRMLVTAGSDGMLEYTLNTAWDITGYQFINSVILFDFISENQPNALAVSPDGNTAIIIGQDTNSILSFKTNNWQVDTTYLSNSYINVTQVTGETRSRGLYFSEEGSNVYIVGRNRDNVHQITLNTAFELGSVGKASNLYIGARETEPNGIWFKPDGSRMYIVGQINVVSAANTVYQYTLSQSWNIQTATFSAHYNIAQDLQPLDISFNSNGDAMYIVGNQNDSIYQYTLATPWQVSTASLVGAKSLSGVISENSLTGLFIDKNETRAYIIGTATDAIYQTQLLSPGDITSLTFGSSAFSGSRGTDYLVVPVAQKTANPAIINQIGYVEQQTELSAKITSYDVSGRTITVLDEVTGGTKLSDKLPATPFIAKLPQHLLSSYFKNTRSIYLEGTRKTVKKSYDVDGITNFSANIKIVPISSSFVKVYEDLQPISFNIVNRSNIEATINQASKKVDVVVDYYTVPTVEVGDTVSLYEDFNAIVTGASYVTTDPTYNAYLTANSVYRITIDRNLPKTVKTGSRYVNITPDLHGTIASISPNDSFIIDYDSNVYSNAYTLTNYQVYSMSVGTTAFKRADLDDSKTIKNLVPGKYIVKTRNKSGFGRVSSYTTKEIDLSPITLGKITDLSVTEKIFIDTGQAASVRAIISFTPVDSEYVVDYELSYKVSGTDIADFNTVILPRAGVDSNGKINYVINNIDRGSISGQLVLSVRVTPLNNDLRGIPAELEHTIVGKTNKPLTVTNFTVKQFQDTLFFSYSVPKLGDGKTPVDLDLNYIDIRRLPGIYSNPTIADFENIATPVIVAATPSTSSVASASAFGTFTFIVRTIDTSGNYSDEIAAAVITIVEPTDVDIYAVYSESNPSGNLVSTSSNNINYTDNVFPSFSNSFNFGLSAPGSSYVDNANGTSSGWTQGSDSNVYTLFTQGATANYQTQIRTLSDNVAGSVRVNYSLATIYAATYNDERTNIFSATSCVSASANVFIYPGIGNTYLFDATYDTINKTLANTTPLGNVFAIWHANNHVSNANSYALIAGVINNNALALGATFYANGSPTGGNLMPNLTTSAGVFTLVNLKQYGDDSVTTYQGNPGAITSTLYIRYANSSPLYYANNNVRVQNLTAWSSGVGSRETFKNFQLRLDVNNSDPNSTIAQLTDFNYYVQIPKRSYQTTVVMDSNPKTVNYAAAGFVITPKVTGIVGQNIGYAISPDVISVTATQAQIRIYKASDGSLPTGITVILSLDGG